MLEKFILIISGVFIFTFSYSQTNVANDFDFIAQKIKNEYIGFLDKTNDKNFNFYQNKVKASGIKDEFHKLSMLTIFFKDLHLKLYDYNFLNKIDTQICKLNYNSIVNNLHSPNKLRDKVEGYWLSDYHNCIIGIKKTKNTPLTYEGYIVENKKKAPLGFKIFTMRKNLGREDFTTDYFDENLGFRTILNTRFKNKTTIFLNSYGKWTKLKKYEKGLIEKFTDFNFDFKLVEIKKEVLLLTMPDFGSHNIKVIDSIIKNNELLISSAKILILDIRNNMGGTVKNYLPLFRFFCTNNIIRSSWVELRKSKIKEIENQILKLRIENDSIKFERYQIYLNSLKKSNEIYLLNTGDTIFCTKKLPKIKNIAIIVNNNSISAAELMVLDFKQSSNVKIFGEQTGGAIDYLNAEDFETPSGKYELSLATAKRKFTKLQPSYDKFGIMPDIEIPTNTTDWIDFVIKFYETKKH